MRRQCFCFFLVVVFSLTFHFCEAAVVGPDLQAILQAAPSSQEVAIIINLADRVDINQIPIVPANYSRGGKAFKRNAFAKAFKDKADKTQGPLKTFIQGRSGRNMRPLWITNSIAVTVPASVISELISRPEIASIELDAVVQAMPIVPAPAGTPRWNIDRVNAPDLWAAGIIGSGSVVANFDTGVDVNHPDLKYRWRGGSCSTPPDCPSWFDPYGNTTLPFAIPATGNNFTELDATHAHGTHTMGIMVGGTASFQRYAIGVAPGAQWIAAKIFDDFGNSTVSVILQAFAWALCPGGDPANPSSCAPSPDVVNNSWTIASQNTCDSSLLTAISNVTAAGIEVVFAAGNMAITTPATTSSSSFSPANNAGVFAVGATDCVGSGCASTSNVIAPYSALGPSACDGTTPGQRPARTTSFPNIVAPGSNIYSSVPTGGRFDTYNYFFGTSMAAPHISGAAALLAGAMPALTPANIEDALQQTALPLGSPDPNNTYGYGLLDAEAAYKYAFINYSGKGDAPQIAALPSAAYFINNSNACTFDMFQNPPAASCTILIVNQGTADLMISGVSISGDFVITSGGDGCSGQTIHSLSSCSVTVTFSPGTTGSRTGQLSVASDDTATPTLNLALRGNDPVALVQGSAVVATYADIQTASGDCSNWDTIKMLAAPLIGSPDFNLPLGIAVSLLGGYDPAFGSQNGFTTIHGTLTISRGTVTVGNVIVMQ